MQSHDNQGGCGLILMGVTDICNKKQDHRFLISWISRIFTAFMHRNPLLDICICIFTREGHLFTHIKATRNKFCVSTKGHEKKEKKIGSVGGDFILFLGIFAKYMNFLLSKGKSQILNKKIGSVGLVETHIFLLNLITNRQGSYIIFPTILRTGLHSPGYYKICL